MHATVEQHEQAAHVAALRRRVEEALAALVPAAEPEGLYAPVRYVLAGQGKRVRPILVLLAADLFGVAAARALPAALAVEVFHNFTLVHDDVMDHADARRGRPTVHVRWDEDTALLTGDYLLALAYDLLARLDAAVLPAVLRRFSTMVARLCEGQTLDKAFEQRADVTVDDYLGMIDRKTGALLQCALELGGLVGGAPAADLDALGGLGLHLGRAFQIQDDLLDLVADDDRWGKPVGGDLVEAKKTFLLLLALERSTGAEHDYFARVVAEGGLEPAEVPEARARMDGLGVLDAARRAVLDHTAAALDALGRLPEGPPREVLGWLVRRMQARLH